MTALDVLLPRAANNDYRGGRVPGLPKHQVIVR